MEASVLQENLAKGLSIISRAVSSRSTLPVLSNVLIATDGGKLKLSATNLEIGINCWIGAKVAQEGAITIPARLLSEFVSSLPQERIYLKLDKATQTLNLRCDRVESNIKGIEAKEFPVVPLANGMNISIKLDPVELKAMIDQVIFSAATDEARPILTGVLIRFDGEMVIMATADGFRLSVRKTPVIILDGEYDPFEVIVPAKALKELAKVCGDQQKTIEVCTNPNRKQILFHLENVDLVSQLIEGNFPDFNQIIPKTYSTRSVVGTRELLKAVRVSHLFARDSANILKFHMSEGFDGVQKPTITLTAMSPELGDNVVDLDAIVAGFGMDVAFNAKYLIDVLSVIDSPEVIFEITAPSKKGTIRPGGDDKFTHVIMPMYISTEK